MHLNKLSILISIATASLLPVSSLAQNGEDKVLSVGPDIDIPLSSTFDFSYGVGISAGYIVPAQKNIAWMLSGSVMAYRQQLLVLPVSIDNRRYYYKWGGPVFKAGAGFVSKIAGTWYLMSQFGVVVDANKFDRDYSLRPWISLGPSAFLKLPSGKRFKIGFSGFYSQGMLLNVGVGYCFSLKK